MTRKSSLPLACSSCRATVANDSGLGVESGGRGLWDFGGDGTLTIETPYGLLLRPAHGPHGVGTYRGMAKLIEGTGQFHKATGTVLIEGTYVLWFTNPADTTTARGRWNADITARICKGE